MNVQIFISSSLHACQGQESGPLLHFPELEYFVQWKSMIRKMVIFSLLVLIKFMNWWNTMASKLMRNAAALSLHGHNDNIIILFQTRASLFTALHLYKDAFLWCDAWKLSSDCVTSGFYYSELNKMFEIIYFNEYGQMHIQIVFYC